jgi:hypothetical protein
LEVRVKKKRFTEEQIASALAQESTGQSVGIAYVDRSYTGEQAQDDAEAIIREDNSYYQKLAFRQNFGRRVYF